MRTIFLYLFVCCTGVSIISQTNELKDSRDGKIYKTVRIGQQTWMAQNLNYKVEESWNYKNKSSDGSQYGRLYSWEAAKGACPPDWHLPSKEEFETLINSVGGEGNPAYVSIKNGGSSGFSALFGGFRGDDGSSNGMGTEANFWSSSPSIYEYAWSMGISNDLSRTVMYVYYRSCGFSVRCVQD
jgi:uncharacterized protein (TIGR02145 family)